ncbi:hypothetical protein EMCRGX_G018800 [Ephydatia muelleri]
MAGAGGEELGRTREDQLITPQTPSAIDGSLFSFGTQQNGVFNPYASRILHDDVDPKESLSSLGSRTSVTSMPLTPDYDLVYHMLQERERDLELAARLGQALLQRNEMLESDLSAAIDLRQRHEHQIAQLKHDLMKKEALVQLYLEDVNERECQNGNHSLEGEGEPSWVKELAEECHQLRESNEFLHSETEKLRRDTLEIEQKEKDVLQLCLDQLTSTKENLGGLRLEVEQRSTENHHLRIQLDQISSQHHQDQMKLNLLLSENEDLKEKLLYFEASHLSLSNELAELQHIYEQYVEEKQSEIQRLKEMSGCRSAPSESSDGSESFLGAVEHESIVHEIEEALRKEIIAASTLSERPRSPNHYAQQRTMVVMETVRAATTATAKRRERLKNEQDRKEEKEDVPSGPQGSKGMSELAVPSTNQDSRGFLTPPPKTFSPLLRSKLFTSPAGAKRTPKNTTSPGVPSARSIPDSLSKHHNRTFFSPEKLQIVKPLEGVLLCRLPPGVQMKGWARAGIVDTSTSSPEAHTTSHTSPPTQKLGRVGFADLSSLEDSSVTPLQTVAMTPLQTVAMTPLQTVAMTPLQTVAMTPLQTVAMTPAGSQSVHSSRESSVIRLVEGLPGFGYGSPVAMTNTSFNAITDVQ